MFSNYGPIYEIQHGKDTLPEKDGNDFNPTMLIVWCEPN
jgi:hypothetical protein